MYQVLIVDDEIQVIEDLERNVDWRGIGVRHLIRAESVQEAVELYDIYTPQIVISDIEMVGKSGLDLLKLIQERKAGCRFLFLTCHPEFEYMRKAIQLGCCDYLLKPVDYLELTGVVRRLMHGLENDALDEAAERMPLNGEHDLVLKACRYITEHMVEKIRISDLASYLGCSESTLTRSFKNETGWSIVEYITEQRIARAVDLLKNTDWSIQMIAGMCGYDDGAYFSRVFKRSTGIAPTDYQKNSRGMRKKL